MLKQLLMRHTEVPMNGCNFEGAVYPFDLPVRPWTVEFGQSVVYAMLFTDAVKQQRKSIFVSGTIGQLNAIIGQNRMNFVGDSRNEVSQELRGYRASCWCVQLGKGEF